MRDEFDSHHQNSRVGWVRDLKGSRLKIFNAFQDTDKDTLEEIVNEILFNSHFEETEGYRDIDALFSERKQSKSRDKKAPMVFVSRGPTGRAAESFFIEYFGREKKPIHGDLEDCRDLGLGYDFVIKNGDESCFVEVKGLAAQDGGILFTNKEWKTASREGQKYYLIVIRNLATKPEILTINNPARKLTAKKNIYSTVQVSWGVAGKELNRDVQ